MSRQTISLLLLIAAIGLVIVAAATLVPQSGLSEGLRRGVNRPKRARGPKLDHELIGPLVLGDLGMG